ncbi:hypothetical protein JTB14_007294 [Gonioctena quinquepunctata]|nr:hypothetical protein JTB14_007294 [Gonioctena quinquepunctata]
MQDVANGKRTHLKNPDNYTDVYYTICEIWKKEIPEIWEAFKVNFAKLKGEGEVLKSNEDYMEDEYFNHLSNSETDEEIPEKSQRFREREGKLEEIKTNKMSMFEVTSGIQRLLAEGKTAREKKETEEMAKQNLPPLKMKPPPCLHPSVTVKEPDGKIDKGKVAKNTYVEQGINSENFENPKNNEVKKTDEKNQGKIEEKPVSVTIVQTDGPTDLSSDDESTGLADNERDITKIKSIKPKIKPKKRSNTPRNTPETSEKRDDTPQSPGIEKGKIQLEKEPPIILEGKKC